MVAMKATTSFPVAAAGTILSDRRSFTRGNRTPNRTSTGLDNSSFGQMPSSKVKIYVISSRKRFHKYTTPTVVLCGSVLKMGTLCGDPTNTLFISTYKEVDGRNRSLSFASLVPHVMGR